jgi:5-methylcytosine-specific restriction endonuclease McrA
MDKQLTVHQKWIENHKEQWQEYCKKYREDNRDYYRRYSKRYYAENQDKCRGYYHDNKEYKLQLNHDWKQRNKKGIKDWSKQYYEANREKLLKGGKAWRTNNKERMENLQKAWGKTEKGRLSHKRTWALRRTREKDLDIAVIQRVYEDNIKKYGTLTCYLCELPVPFKKDHLEHKIPLSRGGTNEYNNLAIACQHCNCKKHNKTVDEFLTYLTKERNF